jgi:heme o synthase
MTTQELVYRQSFRENVSGILCLIKVKISLFAALSAVAGLFSVSRPSAMLLTSLAAGVFLMAAGAGALNHYQERHSDALMNRTAGRPLPAGRINPGSVLFMSVFLILSGCAVLLLTGEPWASLLGLATVFWYNGFYTWLKTFSRFAAIPGALVGAIPPAIGWIAGDGNIIDPRLAILCFFFFIWQVLHFFIHMHVYGKEYEKARLPSLSSIFSQNQLDRLALQWLLATVVSTQFIVLFGVIHSPLAHTIDIAASIWLVFQGITFIGKSRNAYACVFRKINYYMLLIILLIILDGFSRYSGLHHINDLL